MSEQNDIKYKLNSASSYDYYERKRQLVLEYQIAIETMGIVRDQLGKCAREEGVNQFRNCRELREKYLKLQQDRYHGMLFPEDLEPKNRNIPGVFVSK